MSNRMTDERLAEIYRTILQEQKGVTGHTDGWSLLECELTEAFKTERKYVAELEAERDRLSKHMGLCRAHWETPMDKRSDGIGCPICLMNRIEELEEARDNASNDRDMWRSKCEELEKRNTELFDMDTETINELQKRIAELEEEREQRNAQVKEPTNE